MRDNYLERVLEKVRKIECVCVCIDQYLIEPSE